MNSSLVLNNSIRHIGRIRQESEDFSFSDHRGTIERIKTERESSSVVTSLQKTKAEEIEKIINEKNILIDKRNKIFDNPIKHLLFRKKILEIDAQIDVLDLQLYLLETENSIKKSDLDEMISTAEMRLEKYSKYLRTK